MTENETPQVTETETTEDRLPEVGERDANGVLITPIMRAAMEIKF